MVIKKYVFKSPGRMTKVSIDIILTLKKLRHILLLQVSKYTSECVCGGHIESEIGSFSHQHCKRAL